MATNASSSSGTEEPFVAADVMAWHGHAPPPAGESIAKDVMNWHGHEAPLLNPVVGEGGSATPEPADPGNYILKRLE